MLNARDRGRHVVLACVLLFIAIAPAAPAQIQLTQLLIIDVPTATVDGSFLLNGVPFSAEYGDLGLFNLTHAGDAAAIPLGVTTDQVYGPRVVVSGDYTPTYEFVFSSGAIPVNPNAVVGPLAPLSSVSILDVDVASIDVTFDLSLNGKAFSTNASQSGDVLLRDVASGVEFAVGNTSTEPFVVKIVPGVYDVVEHRADKRGIRLKSG